MLIKNTHTQPQTTLAKTARLQNIKGTFQYIPRKNRVVEETHIILLDDVTTTGATLEEAKATLLSYNPASIVSVALAH